MTRDEQQLIRDSVRRFLGDRFPLAEIRRMLDEPRDELDREAWTALAEQGWIGMAIPERFGGLGLSAAELCVVCEEMGRALVPLPFTATAALLPFALLASGSSAQKEKWLPLVASGEIACTLAVTDIPDGKQAVRFAEGRLSGSKMPVVDGIAANFAIVTAREDDGMSLFLVDLLHPGASRKRIDSIDPSRPLAAISFDEVPAERLGTAGNGPVLLDDMLTAGIIPLAFEQLGGAQRCIETAADYARERFAFGRAIGSFQAIKHKLADVFIRIEVARLACEQAAETLDAHAPDIEIAAAAARIAACDAYWLAAKENIQVHGGIGFTWEMDCHLFYRRSKLLGVTWGPAFEWKDRLARHLLETSDD